MDQPLELWHLLLFMVIHDVVAVTISYFFKK